MLDKKTLDQVAGVIGMIASPVEFVASLDDTDRSAKMRELLEEVSALSDKISLVEEPDKRTPSFGIRQKGEQPRVRFAGLPMGHEFSSFVLALLQVGGHEVKADADTIEEVTKLSEPHEFVTYMSLTCQNCPDVVQALNAMAVLNPNLSHTAVEGGAFRAEVDGAGVKTVPTVYMDGQLFGQGRMSMAEIVAKLDTGSAARTADKLNQKEPFDVLVVGAGPAGASSAIYSARKGFNVGVAAGRVGGQVNDTAGIENLIAISKTQGSDFAAELRQNMVANGVDLMESLQAERLSKEGDLFVVEFAGDVKLKAKSVILDTGARYRTTGIPGEEELRNKGVTFCPHCDGPLFQDKPVAVIGGGNSAIEAAIDLAGLASHVTVVELMDHLGADQVLVDKLNSLPNTRVLTSATSKEILGSDAVSGLVVQKSDGSSETLPVEGVFVQIGLVPNTEWLEGTLELDRGQIAIDRSNATSIPGVFAAGDCTNVPHKQIVVAMGEGANAALGSFEHSIRN
ncbi:alkyl hydroperoxide reductase subunit F [Winkia sp. UMB3105]|uniref:alkyl hydroperoxide reductase subunit F n=1 Tax=Winkia sp. UMB3105 TaxID=3046332 RepID=UPI002553E981|nr:alkyl hydroperoxide reductase subunit F [Winkia sp. UMB3105]MDK7163283.1 alkyl hydroperoxide reductase subunit F [Winkia sp. UMB3105]